MPSCQSADHTDIAITHKMVLGIAVPMTLGLITVPIVGMVDMAVIGQLGDAALMGAIAIGALLISVVSTSFNFLRMGTTGLAAQALGKKDPIAQRAVLYRALILAFLLGMITVLVGPFLLPFALDLMGGGQSVSETAHAYVSIRLWAMPAALANYVLFGWLFGMGYSRSGMVLLVLLNCINIGATILFVMGLGLGVAGAAWGTVLAEYLAIFAGLLWIARLLGRDWAIALPRLFNRAAFARFMQLNGDIFIRSLVLLLAFGGFTALSARQGDVVLAANELLMTFFLIGSFFLDGIAVAAEQLAGRAIGAHQRQAFARSVSLCLQWGLGLGAGLTLLFWFGGPLLIDLLTTASEVRLVANDYLHWVALTPLVTALAFQLDGVFVGATWSKDMRSVSILSSALFALCAWLLLPIFGNDGLWVALLVFLACRGLGLLFMLPRRSLATFG
ncbi:MAG: MATE family efflux transporter [Cohaesibacter sp.]|nr:MATE family efflux transporter [Cohaesibacter sp.]